MSRAFQFPANTGNGTREDASDLPAPVPSQQLRRAKLLLIPCLLFLLTVVTGADIKALVVVIATFAAVAIAVDIFVCS